MSIYIVRPKTESVARSLNLSSRKFTPESRQTQVEEVVNFWQENKTYRTINQWIEEATSREENQILKYPIYSGITGVNIVEMPDEEAERMRQELPSALIVLDQPIEIILPDINVADVKGEVTADELWHLEAIGLETARKQGFTGKGKNITIAVLDTGIDSTHPELRGKVAECHGFNPRNQQIQLIPSQDTDGHGTHVAGLICGQQVGVAPEVSLISSLMLPNRRGNLSDLYLWLDWLGTRQDVKIANISAGTSVYLDDISDLIDTLLAVGILPVCAVGNDGINKTNAPANCRGALSIGSANSDGQVSWFSGSGRLSINNHIYDVPYLVAPGEKVFSAIPGGSYKPKNGTSMATPIVSGVAALILEKYASQITVGRLIDALLSTCKDLGQDANRQGKGLVQVKAAL